MLTSLRISNYRAFRELRIDELSRINLISGRNNSGKTTLLEALLMLSAGHPEITLHTAIIRGMKSERLPPAAIPLIYPMVSVRVAWSRSCGGASKRIRERGALTTMSRVSNCKT